jgi:hypothetical protein
MRFYKKGEGDFCIIFESFSHQLHGSITLQTLLLVMNEGIVLDVLNRKIVKGSDASTVRDAL